MASDTPAFEKAPDVPRPRWSYRLLLVLGVAVVLPIGATVVYHFPPSEYPYYPPCLFHVVTGLHCPGCGMTRCVGALVRGDVEQAFAYNPLFILFLPVIAYLAVRIAYEMWTGKKMKGLAWPKWSAYVFVGVMFAYAIARNIPVYPFDLLAPHELPR